MKNSLTKGVIVLLVLLSFTTKSFAQDGPNIPKLDDAVVVVLIYDHYGEYLGHGSGFLIDSKGTVVTNYHVVKGASSLVVRTDINDVKKEYNIDRILAGDENKDLAILAIDNTSSTTFPFLEIATEFPVKGTDCWAIGTPEDPEYMNTVSKGLVANLMLDHFPKTIQTNAEITHGSSGGALINDKSQVIGVTSSGRVTEDGARASINFAIWIGEIEDLPSINETTLVNQEYLPCELSFYTDNPFADDAHLYVDDIYIGKFSLYFEDEYVPTCSEEGTITRNLYSGMHTYDVYYSSTGETYSGTVNLRPGQCKIFNVAGATETISNNGSESIIRIPDIGEPMIDITVPKVGWTVDSEDGIFTMYANGEGSSAEIGMLIWASNDPSSETANDDIIDETFEFVEEFLEDVTWSDDEPGDLDINGIMVVTTDASGYLVNDDGTRDAMSAFVMIMYPDDLNILSLVVFTTDEAYEAHEEALLEIIGSMTPSSLTTSSQETYQIPEIGNPMINITAPQDMWSATIEDGIFSMMPNDEGESSRLVTMIWASEDPSSETAIDDLATDAFDVVESLLEDITWAEEVTDFESNGITYVANDGYGYFVNEDGTRDRMSTTIMLLAPDDTNILTLVFFSTDEAYDKWEENLLDVIFSIEPSK